MKIKHLALLFLLIGLPTFSVAAKKKESPKPVQTEQNWWQRRSPEFKAFIVTVGTVTGVCLLRYGWLKSLRCYQAYKLRNRNMEQEHRRRVGQMQRVFNNFDPYDTYIHNLNDTSGWQNRRACVNVPSTLTQAEKDKLRQNNTVLECAICCELDSLPDDMLDGCKNGCSVILCSSCKVNEKNQGHSCPSCRCSNYKF